MWSYNQAFQPPAPFLDIIVRHPRLVDKFQQIPAKPDTGADLSAIPQSIAEKLELLASRTILVEGFDGRQIDINTYAVSLEVVEVRFRPIEVILIPDDYALIGRDILNHFYLLLNGPDLSFDLGSSP